MNSIYKISIISENTVMSNPDSLHNYFGWPSVARLQNGKIAVAASAFRLEHVCPFGKAAVCISEDEGKTFYPPFPVIDTPLDDRDAGLCTFGNNGVIVTSFNNTPEFQRSCNSDDPYICSYLERLPADTEEKYLGSTFRISNDCGVTFGKIYRSGITSPHGPVELKDGRIIWVGAYFRKGDEQDTSIFSVACAEIGTDGTVDIIGKIPSVPGTKLCEPHTVQLDNGCILSHLRDDSEFTVYQSVSSDGGKSWTVPQKILPDHGGSPAHILKHSSGTLVSVYGYREKPYGLKVMFSKDNGNNWDYGNTLIVNGISSDLGYPASIELDDGSIFTVYYAHKTIKSPAEIFSVRWRFDD